MRVSSGEKEVEQGQEQGYTLIGENRARNVAPAAV